MLVGAGEGAEAAEGRGNKRKQGKREGEKLETKGDRLDSKGKRLKSAPRYHFWWPPAEKQEQGTG